MTLLLKQVFSLLKLLNSETGTNQIAAGIAAGFILGMSPLLSLQGILLIFLMLIFRIQLGAAFISSFFFAFIAWMIDPISHSLGYAILQMPALKSFFTTLYNMPLLPYSRFNNTIIMGAGVIGFLLAPLIYMVSKVMIKKYRQSIVQKFQETKLWKLVKSTSLYKWYYQYDKLYNS